MRIQIRLTEDQAARLRRLAEDRRVSMVALVQEAVERLLADRPTIPWEERRRQVMAMAGKYRSGRSDVSAGHDDDFTEAVHDW